MSVAGRIRLLFFVWAACSISACLQIEIDPVLMPYVAGIPDPGPDAPLVRVEIYGDAMDESDWAKALTISRFFYTGVENTTGSPRELLLPAVREVLRQRGYRTVVAEDSRPNAGAVAAPASQGDEFSFELAAERNVILWLPPREFIQTPRARVHGVVRVDMVYESRLYPAAAPGEIVWNNRFTEIDELRVLPGEEGPGIVQGATGAFQNYLRRLQIELPPAAQLRKNSKKEQQQ